ncbi:tail protein X [Kaustia mangrovi]|uniref:Tail protein X n=1 Tax=Kaustia mangrovi TaxID=2593653 RepID=A0A7S8C6Y5_9HYPH|nr:tail protein X [Kaustia mangrovi]QPC44531.1 tail protein X [Kaustia mangrovi]QPC44644.1 tail protein X [Kaustia mangrovi]
MMARSREGDTIDLIAWREMGTTTAVEEILELNPALARLDPVLPIGTPVELPEIVPSPPVRQTVRLWD